MCIKSCEGRCLLLLEIFIILGRGRGILGLKELDPCKKIGGRVQMSAAEERECDMFWIALVTP